MVIFSQPHVSRLMSGRAQCFDIRAINRMVDGLGAPRTFAGLSSETNPLGGDSPVSTEEVTPTHRRTLLAATAALPVAAALGVLDGAHVVTRGQAAQIRSLLPELYKLDDQIGGDAVSNVTRWCLHKVDTVLNTADYGEAAGLELQVAYGELAEMAGWLEFDAGRMQPAQHFFGEALRAAQLANSLTLEVLVLASMIMVARHRGRPREAVQLAQLAQRRAAGWGTPRLAALLAAREAVGWAQAGDGTAAQSAMNRALHTFEREPVPRDDDPTWLSFFDAAELTGLHASVNSYLGRSRQAALQLQNTLDNLGPEYARNRALYAARLAQAYLAEGDDSQACGVLADTLPLFTKVRSARAMAHLSECLNAVSKSRAPGGRDLLAKARALDLVGAA